MKIGVFAHLGIGGADSVASNVARGLVELGHTVTFFYTEKSLPTFVPREHPPGYTLLNRLDEVKNICEAIKIQDAFELSRHSLEVVNIHRSGSIDGAFPGIDEFFPQRNFKLVETNFHGYFDSLCDHRIFPSQSLALKYKQLNYTVISNPILSRRTNENLRKELGLENKLVFGRTGRPDNSIYGNINLTAYKRIETQHTCFLYLAPSPRARQDAQNLGIKNIIFVDPMIDRERLSKLYNTMDIFCYSNNMGETFGNCLAEAMIHGVPAIAYVNEGRSWPQAQAELYEKESPLLIYPYSFEKYLNILIRLATDENFRTEQSSIAKERSKKWEYISACSEYVKCFEEVLSK